MGERSSPVSGSAKVFLASHAAPATLEALLAHLFADRLAHLPIDRFWRQGFAMTFPRGIDRSPTKVGNRGALASCLRGLAHCHRFLP